MIFILATTCGISNHSGFWLKSRGVARTFVVELFLNFVYLFGKRKFPLSFWILALSYSTCSTEINGCVTSVRARLSVCRLVCWFVRQSVSLSFLKGGNTSMFLSEHLFIKLFSIDGNRMCQCSGYYQWRISENCLILLIRVAFNFRQQIT